MAIALTPMLAAGCVSTVKTIATAPFKVVGKGIDWATTSQSEADRNRGRAARKADARAAKEHRRQEKEARNATAREGDAPLPR